MVAPRATDAAPVSRDDEQGPPAPAALTRPAARLLARARRRVVATDRLDADLQRASLRVFDTAEAVLRRLDGVAGVLETAARLEVDLLERMAPIVEDLGELVRLSLDEARERRGLARRAHDASDVDDRVIDVEATTD